MTGKVRTRIAPSPTGFLHLGTARTALYSWAYARHYGGEFVLRIEDTDVARSTQDSVDQILASMHWLGLDYDEGPIYQMQRLDRYREVVAQMLAAGTAYHCYCTPGRARRDARGADARAARRRATTAAGAPSRARRCRRCPKACTPVVRFRNPPDGDVTWDDLVKGRDHDQQPRDRRPVIAARPTACPTYNFAVVVDDWDMAHHARVPRRRARQQHAVADQHLPRARRAVAASSAMCPIILGDDGQKLSKRRGAVSVTAYDEDGYLPEAMLNYLARLGWSHGDDETVHARADGAAGSTATICRRAPRSGTRPSSPG